MINISGLKLSYGAGNVVHGVDLNVEKGEIVAIIGSNGAGKSTILKGISNLVPRKEGAILFNGEDITNVAPEKITELGISHVPEGRRIFNDMSVEENLLLGGYRQNRQSIKGDLERVYGLFQILKERKKQRAGNLSGGEQQMLAIGRALMARPSFLMLDEPSLGLAPLMIKSVFDLVEQIHKEGMTILLIEQNVKLALKYANRIYVLQSGEIVYSGTAEQLAKEEEIMHAYLGTKSLK